MFSKSTSPYRHNIILTHDMTPKIKAKIIALLTEREFLDIMTNDKQLMDEVLVHLDDRCFLLLILTFTDKIIIPMLLKHRTFLTVDRVSQLRKYDNFNGEFYGFDFHHVIANNIDITSEDTINESIKCIHPELLPIDKTDIEKVLKNLSEFISVPSLKILEVKMISYEQFQNAAFSSLKLFGNAALSTVNKPIKWMVDLSLDVVKNKLIVPGVGVALSKFSKDI